MEDEKKGPVLAFTKLQETSKKPHRGEAVRRARRFIWDYLIARGGDSAKISCAELFDAYMKQGEKPTSKQRFLKALREPDEFTGQHFFLLSHEHGESWVRFLT